MAAEAFIGLGSNIGDGPAQLDRALAGLASTAGIRVLAVSAYYRTPAWGVRQQPDFTNAAARLHCDLPPPELLQCLQQLEQAGGRLRDSETDRRWGPRSLDLDLLLYDAHIIDTPELKVPHPLISQRAFVLVPLLDLVEDIELPGQGSARAALAALPAAEAAAPARLDRTPWQPVNPPAPTTPRGPES